MPWVNPIFDRAITDINNRTAKGFFNVVDWTRINGNTGEVKFRVLSMLGLNVSTVTLTVPITSQHPAADDINALIANIELVRDGACLPMAVGLVDLKQDYQAGNGTVAPSFVEVNDWERNLNLLYTLLPNTANYKVYCGVAAVGQPRFWQNRFRG